MDWFVVVVAVSRKRWFAAGGGAQFFVLEGLPLDKAVNFDMAAAAPV